MRKNGSEKVCLFQENSGKILERIQYRRIKILGEKGNYKTYASQEAGNEDIWQMRLHLMAE